MISYRKRKMCNYFIEAAPHLKDIIAINFIDKHAGQGACITWGRVLKEEDLLEVVKQQCMQREFKNIESIRFCYSLQEVAAYPCFYERWIYFVQQTIPYKHGYKKWKELKSKAILEGLDIKFIGNISSIIND